MAKISMENVYYALKSLILILFIFTITYGLYSIYIDAKDFFKKESIINENMIQIAENIKGIKIEYDKGELKDKLSELDKKLLGLIEQRNQEIKDIGIVITKLEGTIKELPSSLHVDNEVLARTFDDTLVYIQDSDGNDVPIARVFYNPYYEGDKWTIKTFDLLFNTTIALGENKDSSDAYVSTWMQNNDIKEYAGKQFPVKINSINWVKRPLKDKQFMVNPRISQIASFGMDMHIGLGVSLYSYGRSKRDMNWTFLKLGISGNKEYAFLDFIPVEYNIGEFVPLIDNMFIGMNINLNNKLDNGFGLTLAIPF